MIPIFGTVLSILSSVQGQIGPSYDPLFYDTMLYIFGTMMFSIFLLGIIGYWIRVHGWAIKTIVRDGSMNSIGTSKMKE